MPPNAPSIGHKMMPNSVSIRAVKKQHTLKNTVMSLPDKFIIFLGRTFSGHNHDYLMLKQELPPELDWFADLNVRVDLGYLGIKSDYRGDQIAIPTKKPRKSQKNPNPQLSDEQKAANKALSQIRIFIEHAIGGMKRYNILVHAFRNRLENFEDDVIGVCAGLWNFVLFYCGTTLLYWLVSKDAGCLSTCLISSVRCLPTYRDVGTVHPRATSV